MVLSNASFLPVIIIPLIQFSSLARPINVLWHLSKWSKWNDCFLSFVQCVRHYVTYVGSLPYLEPIIWWVGRQPTSGEIRVLKSIGGEKHGWCLLSIWQKWTVLLWMGRGEVAFNGYSLQVPNKIKKTHSGGNPAWKSRFDQSQPLVSRLTVFSMRCEKEPFLLIALFIWAACLRLRRQAINASRADCWKTFSKLLIIHHLCHREQRWKINMYICISFTCKPYHLLLFVWEKKKKL